MKKELYNENLKKELASRGIIVDDVTKIINGKKCFGFIIKGSESLSPVVYYDSNDTIDSLLERINYALNNMPSIDESLLLSRDYILQNVYIAVEKRCKDRDDCLVLRYFNLDIVVRFDISLNQKESGSVRIQKEHLMYLNVSEREIWSCAAKNMRSSFSCNTMSSLLGVPDTFCPSPFFVITSTLKYGASALLFPEIFRDFCLENKAQSCIIFPSSTEELLLLCDNGEYNYKLCAEMVAEVNSNEVDPLIQLDPVIYRYDLIQDVISIVAEA